MRSSGAHKCCKGGPKDLCINYRPIFLLLRINKIFEKLFYNRLCSYLEQNGKLSSHQYGFSRCRYTPLAIHDMQVNILKNLEKDFSTCTISCDLSKAFDTIDHDVLLWNMDFCFGIKCLPFKLLATYLQRQQQYAVIDGCTSYTPNITQGAYQGSSLGPLSFALYINDLPLIKKIDSYTFCR